VTRFYGSTKSYCPLCQKLIGARIIEDDGSVWLEKICPEHGLSRVLVSPHPERYRDYSNHIKPAQLPQARFTKEFIGCPDSCGLCPEHGQHTCLPIAEITSLCDLDCPVCLKPKSGGFGLSPAEFQEALIKLKGYERDLILLNLSGGEPTCHEQFSEFIDIAVRLGVAQITVSTNGQRLLKDKALRDIFLENNVVASLQFDGLTEEPYEILRGRRLLKDKMDLIELLEKENLPYSLTAVTAKGVNETQIPRIADLFFNSKALSLMFQPLVITGRAAENFNLSHRLTIDEVVELMETSRHIAPGDMVPLACSHPGCASSAYYFKINDNRFFSLKKFLGLENYQNVTQNRAFPGLDQDGQQVILDKIYDLWADSSSAADDRAVLNRIRGYLKSLEGAQYSATEAFKLGRETIKSVFVHGLMDPHSFDLDRLIKCCNHYLQADGRLVPMCAENVVRIPKES
jgi:uncharacterized radical SAM superfamily Fe-S cluster-containing enzyme